MNTKENTSDFVTKILKNTKNIIKENYNHNPLDNTDLCNLITTKKEKFYIHKYRPSILINQLRPFLPDEYIKYIEEVCDLKDDKDDSQLRCNCISISLYNPNPSKNLSLKYLASIRRTILNVASQLDGWIVRIYLDTSMFYYFANYSTIEEKEILNFIFNAENTEIYTYVCEKLLDNSIDIARTRSFRFLILIDNSVNISIIREADGSVPYLDCHNIRVFV
jgi:hypothetical protein